MRMTCHLITLLGLMSFIGLISSTSHAAISDDVVYGRFYNNQYQLYRNDGATMQESVGTGYLAGIDSGILEMVGTTNGDVIVARQYNNTFDLFRYDGSTLTKQNTSPSKGIDSGFLGMVATSGGDVVVGRRYNSQFDLLHYDVDPDSGNSGYPNVTQKNGSSLAGLDDGFLGMVASTDNHVVVARHYGNKWDLLRYNVDPAANNAGFPNVVEANRGTELAGMDDGFLGMVAATDGHVVMSRHYGGQWDLLRYDVTADPIVEANRGTSLAGMDDGFLDMVTTKSGDVVMVRHYNDVWELLRYDVTGASITEAARSPSGRGRDNGYLGAVALGNGDIVLGRQGGANQVELFLYDGVTLNEKANNLSSLRGVDHGFIGMTGFSFIPEPTTMSLLVGGLATLLFGARRKHVVRG